MNRLIFVALVLLIASCSAAPGERVRRHGYDYGHGGYGGGHGGGHGGYGGHGYGGQGYLGSTFPLTQSYSQSKASASASSSGGSVSG